MAVAQDRRINNNCPILAGDHHAERDGYIEIVTVVDSPILSRHTTTLFPHPAREQPTAFDASCRSAPDGIAAE